MELLNAAAAVAAPSIPGVPPVALALLLRLLVLLRQHKEDYLQTSLASTFNTGFSQSRKANCRSDTTLCYICSNTRCSHQIVHSSKSSIGIYGMSRHGKYLILLRLLVLLLRQAVRQAAAAATQQVCHAVPHLRVQRRRVVRAARLLGVLLRLQWRPVLVPVTRVWQLLARVLVCLASGSLGRRQLRLLLRRRRLLLGHAGAQLLGGIGLRRAGACVGKAVDQVGGAGAGVLAGGSAAGGAAIAAAAAQVAGRLAAVVRACSTSLAAGVVQAVAAAVQRIVGSSRCSGGSSHQTV